MESYEMKRAIIIDPKDNVASLLANVRKNERVQAQLGEKFLEIEMQDSLLFGHKFALRPIKKGEAVIKYGEIIGRTTQDIAEGGHVHVHNVESLRGRGDLSSTDQSVA
jgi:altronate dehydratase small subunit